jgi:hypothetical protein
VGCGLNKLELLLAQGISEVKTKVFARMFLGTFWFDI